MDEVENFRHRKPEEINLDLAAAHDEQLKWLARGIWVPVFVLGVLLLIASIYPQAARNISATIAANQEQ